MVKLLLWFFASLTGLIVLGAVVIFFGLGFYLSPQSKLARSDVIVAISGGDTASRTDEAIKLYKEHWAPKLIFSGAALDPNSVSNAKAMEDMAVAQGVPSRDIIIEENSENTDQNALGVAKIVQQQNMKQIILVTSPYHQRRASILFGRSMGSQVKIINHSAPDQNWSRSRWWANPTSRALTWSELQKTLFVLWSK